MTPTPDQIEAGIRRIRELAAFAVENFTPVSDVPFGYNRESVQWVEGFIERMRDRRGPAEGVPVGLVNTLGAFLGECLVTATGGVWEWSDRAGDYGIQFAAGPMAFPFAKVWKQFENGLEGGDSIAGFYDFSVNYLATGKFTGRNDDQGIESETDG